ncbi:MAG: hypothetical protein AAB473_03210 [Patescibacteria group bacterium]
MNDPVFGTESFENTSSKERAPQQHSTLETLLQAAKEEGKILDAYSATDFELIANESLAAIADHGSLESLDDDAKRAFIAAAFTKLKPGGMYSLFHRSEDKHDIRGIGRSREFLEALFPKGVEHVLDWNESLMVNGADGGQPSWSTIVRKPGSSVSVAMILNSAMTLGAEERDKARSN